MESPKTATSQDSKLHFLDYWRIIRIRKTIILAVFLLVVITVTAVTLSLTQVYMSTARMRVEKDTADISPFGGGSVQQFDAYFLATEFEVFKSRMILDRVKLCDRTWVAPALADGRLYVRDRAGIYCYDLRTEFRQPPRG